jgi:hypothetical protein
VLMKHNLALDRCNVRIDKRGSEAACVK